MPSFGKESACNAVYPGSIPGLGRSPGEENGNLLQYSCLGYPMDREAWWTTVHGFTKSQTQLSDFQFSATLRLGFPGGATGKEPAYQCRRHNRVGFDPWVRKIPWRREWQTTSVFLPGESQGQRSLVGYGPQGHKESDMTKAT